MYYTRMRLLSRYVCTYFLRYFSMGLLVCIGLFFIVELFDSMDDFIARQVFWGDAVHYLLLRLPSLVYQIVPAIFLLASVLTFSTLVKYNEIVAMRSSGIAPVTSCRAHLSPGLYRGALAAGGARIPAALY